MSKRNKKKSKLGWFGWSLITTIMVIIGSGLFFFNIYNLSFKSLFDNDSNISLNEEKEDEATPEKVAEQVETTQKTVGRNHQEIGVFVSEMHDFYNRTTGYGGINSLDWQKQIDQTKQIEKIIKEKLPRVENEALKKDLKYIQSLAKQTIENKKTSLIRNLHRMFHDLDIALNSYNGTDKIWNVTETLTTGN